MKPNYRRILWFILLGVTTPYLRVGAQTYAFTTLAGTSGYGYADGTGSAARFGLTESVAVDSAGNVYVADYGNYVIRKITPDGTVSTLAGLAGVSGSVDGKGSSARFSTLLGVAVDGAGNVYVADTGNYVIRKITPDGTVSTLAGTARNRGTTDGTGSVARFFQPGGVAVDGAGNVYVADTGNHTIRKITPTGAVSTPAGQPGLSGSADGAVSVARFNRPNGVAADSAGNVYVADTDNENIRKITPDGTVSTLAGLATTPGSTEGTGSAARFNDPRGLIVDSAGNVYVADRHNYAIRKITPGGAVSTLAGRAGSLGSTDGTGNAARFYFPSGVAVDTNGNVYVGDTYNSTVRKITPSGVVTTLAGLAGSGSTDGVRNVARFFQPGGVAVDGAGNVYVADTFNHVIRKITPAGTVSTIAGLTGTPGSADGVGGNSRFAYPIGIGLDGVGNVYVADTGNATIRKITPAGVVGTLAGLAGSRGSTDGTGSAARFYVPWHLTVDGAGNVYVTDLLEDVVRKITPAGVVTTLAGLAGATGSVNGAGSAARFDSPAGIGVDSAGNVYVAETGNDTVRKITPAGVVTTVAGLAGRPGSADGTGSAARFYAPDGLAVDSAGNIYVSDRGNGIIRKITPAGVVTTVAGFPGFTGYADGVGTAVKFRSPTGIAVDNAGNVYVADTNNNVIRKGGQARVANPTSRILNLSVRASVIADQRLIVGFVMSGGSKPVLVRAIGPGLAPHLPGAALAGDPRLELYNAATTLIDANDNWGGTTALRNAFASVGAFPLAGDSSDAAVLRAIDGAHTAHMLATATGVGLIEAYDTGSGHSPHLINVSARYQVSSGTGVLVTGFVIDGSNQKTLLIRGVGPTLAAAPYGLSGMLADPKIEVYNSAQQKIAENDNWASSLASTFSLAGAFDLLSGSKDAALLLTLPPGLYTAQLTGADGGAGEGLVEVYEVGN